jgi:hypothetical protein
VLWRFEIYRLKFNHVWPDLPVHNNLFTWLFTSLPTSFSRSSKQDTVLIEGVYKPTFTNLRSRLYFNFDQIKSKNLSRQADIKIKVITEALSFINTDNYDLVLGFEKTNLELKRIYFPLWYLLPNILENGTPLSMQNRFGRYPNQEYYLIGRKPLSKQDFFNRTSIIGFINNLTTMRVSEMSLLENYLGFNNLSKAASNHEIFNKSAHHNVAKFIYCPENSNFDGYVTEKLFESYACGSVPLWKGEPGESPLNSKSYININDFEHMSELIEFLQKVNTDLDLFNSLYTEPLLLKKPDYSSIRKVFAKMVI